MRFWYARNMQAALPGRFEPLATPEQEAAEHGYDLYRHIRSGAANTSSPTLGRTLEIMLVVLQVQTFSHPMPPADMDVLARLAAEHDWEGAYQRTQAEDDLGAEDGELRKHLLWLRRQLPGYQTAVEHLSQTMRENGFATWDDARVGEKIWGTLLGAIEKTDAIELRLRERIDDHKQAAARTKRVTELYATLLGHYGGRGPQYDVTCHSLAVVTADIEAARRPGRRATPEGVDTLQKLVALQASLVNQLQKFTESTKVDTTDGGVLRELANAIATCALRRVIPILPEMAAEIIEDMQRELLARGVPGVEATIPVEINPPRQAEEIAS